MPGSGTGLDRETKPGEAPCLETQHGWFISKHSLQPLPKPWEEQNTDKLLRWQTRGGSQIRQGSCSLGRAIPQSHGRVQPPLWEPVALRGRGGTWRGAGVAFVLSLRHWGRLCLCLPALHVPGCCLGRAGAAGDLAGLGRGCQPPPGPGAVSGDPGVTAESHSLDVPPGVLSRDLLCPCSSNPVRGMEKRAAGQLRPA